MAEKSWVFPSTSAQQRLWFLDRLEPGSSVYNISEALRLTPTLNVAALHRTLNEIVRRHETLRTSFKEQDGIPVQVIAESAGIEMPVIELTALPEAERQQQAHRLASEEAHRAFELSQGPLFRATLLRLSETDHILLLTVHHIISDGWSMGVLFKEMAVLYEAFCAGKASPLEELGIQYGDYAVWQREYLQGSVLERQIRYWSKQLGGAPGVLDLPTDRPRPAVQSYRGERARVVIGEQLASELKELSRREGVTVFMVLLAAFKTLLYRYSSQHDILIGTPIANRTHAEIENLIGYFANTLVLRTNMSGNPTFKELLKRVREVTLGAYEHQDLPFEKLVEEIQPERSLSYAPLFQVVFGFLNTPNSAYESAGLISGRLEIDRSTARSDLSVFISETGDNLSCLFEYSTDLFDRSTILRMIGHFQALLHGVTVDPEKRLSEVPVLTTEERQLLLTGWNSAETGYSRNCCIHQRFEEQAARSPAAIAVVCGAEQLSYGDLNRRANQLAHFLRRQGIGPESLVGICVERSIEMVIGLLGILKTGGAYVPLDPAYPTQRLSFMIRNAGVQVVLAQKRTVEKLSQHDISLFCLDADWNEIAAEAQYGPQTLVTPENLAYVIYTSGSTGEPKGVQITHLSVLHLLEATRPIFDFNPLDVWTVFHSFSFDFSVWEIFGALLNGGRLVIVPVAIAQSPVDLYELLRTERVTILNQTPSAVRQLIQVRNSLTGAAQEIPLRLIISGGEALKREIAAELLEWGLPVWNFYGPTEATVWAATKKIEQADLTREYIPVGRPIGDVQLYVLDKHQQPVAIGIPGELHIGGVGVARGYLDSPDLTAERFIPDPFGNEMGARVYKTGDLVRYLSDGNIEFLGRIDHQVKIRGFRIELEEIEAVLARHPEVREAVVTVHQLNHQEKELIAYVVARDDRTLSANKLRSYLQEKLPEYMVPSRFVMLDGIPITPNAKVDRRALPDPAEYNRDLDKEYVAPRTPSEELLANIWAEMLKINRIGIRDNFFELGGHSLLGMQVISRVQNAFEVELPLRCLFCAPTVADLANQIEMERISHQGLQTPSLRRVTRGGELPLSFAQQRLWFIEQLESGNTAYNILRAVRLKGNLNESALRLALNEIVRRHETLRTSFKEQDGIPVQVIAESAGIEMPVIELTALPEAKRQQQAYRLASEEAHRPFELSQGPLFRATLLRLSETDHILLLTVHHIISDGWSMGVLFKEMAVLYEAFCGGKASPLEELGIQYGDYAVWQREYLQGSVLERQIRYWSKQLGGAPGVLDLPTDRPRPAVQSYRGERARVVIGEQLASELKELSRREGVTVFMVLLAAFETLLYRYSSQHDILIGTDVANRNQVQTEGLIGFFVNLLVIRADLSGNPTFKELLKRVREVTLGAYEHQDLPFEKLVEELRPERALNRNPLVQVLFVMQNAPLRPLELTGLTLEPVEISSGTSRFDLALFMSESGQQIVGTWIYSTDLFEASTIGRMSRQFENLLQRIVAQPDGRLESFELLTELEREQGTVERIERQQSQLRKLKGARRRVVDLSSLRAIKTRYLDNQEVLPLVIEPADGGIDLTEWAAINRDFIGTQLLRHGALLFRDFDVSSTSEFEKFAAALCPELFDEYGDLPREQMGGKVYGSTPYPADAAILFHNESSHLHRWPEKIWFFCVKPAEQGGETPILDCRKAYQLLDAKTKERLIEKKLMYVRNFTNGLDVSWQTFFRTTERATVENYCRKNSIDFEWKNDNGLRTRQISPAVIKHPKTGEMALFNQIQLHHASCLDPAVRESLLSMLKEEDLPRNVYYEDGSAIEDSTIEMISKLYRENSVSFPWQQGDIMMLNNMMVAHARNPFAGSRKIVVAMGEMVSKEDLQ